MHSLLELPRRYAERGPSHTQGAPPPRPRHSRLWSSQVQRRRTLRGWHLHPRAPLGGLRRQAASRRVPGPSMVDRKRMNRAGHRFGLTVCDERNQLGGSAIEVPGNAGQGSPGSAGDPVHQPFQGHIGAAHHRTRGAPGSLFPEPTHT